MKEAHDHKRVTPEGRAMGVLMAGLADAECAKLAQHHDEPDERCKSCAFRAGTVPNGCIQTQSDAMKAVVEDVPFMCHGHQDAHGRYDQICHGWFAVRRIVARKEAHDGKKLPPVPWDFSPPEPEPGA